MKCMFMYCASLNELYLSNFKTEKVTDMSEMFNECTSLDELNISNFTFSNEINMKQMFHDCSKELKNKIKALNLNIKDQAFI